MKITVTQDHIDRGEVLECETCPIALAIAEQVKGPLPVSVYGDCVRIGEQTYLLPEVAIDFIYFYDLLEPVEPFTFNLKLIP